MKNINLYYMHGAETLQKSLLHPDLFDQVRPHPLFISRYDRLALKQNTKKSWMDFVPSEFHQAGRLLTENIVPHCFMVTEYGCVNLKGMSLSERANAIIGLAHPDFRKELEKQACIMELK